MVLDGDVTDEMINSAVPSRLLESGKNLIRLPGKVRPEEIIWTYLNETDPEDPVWEALAPFEISWRNLVENAPCPKRIMMKPKSATNTRSGSTNYAVDFRQAKVVHYWIEANKDEAEALSIDFLWHTMQWRKEPRQLKRLWPKLAKASIMEEGGAPCRQLTRQSDTPEARRRYTRS